MDGSQPIKWWLITVTSLLCCSLELLYHPGACCDISLISIQWHGFVVKVTNLTFCFRMACDPLSVLHLFCWSDFYMLFSLDTFCFITKACTTTLLVIPHGVNHSFISQLPHVSIVFCQNYDPSGAVYVQLVDFIVCIKNCSSEKSSSPNVNIW